MNIIVPATSANLGPGFDSLGLALGLYNKIQITPAHITSIQIVGEGEHYVKLKVDNVFVKIFSQILERYDRGAHCKFLFENAIPVSRGLGSSSAVIVSAIYAALTYVGEAIDKQKILNLAIEYENHPDNVTPAVFGGFNVAILEHYGNKIQSQNVVHMHTDIPDSVCAVVAIPTRTMSTKHSRKALPKYYSLKDCVFNLSHSSLLSAAFFQRDWEKLRLASRDRIHQNTRMKALPMLFALQKTALEHGALLSTLSGSGSSFLNICYRDDSKKLASVLAKRFPQCRILELGFDNMGVREF
ncbi:homoserine kinase [Helicobacter sp.]|uniref:homoserine kinase n=1 Tax=Helicobacter sp. TaxID=218 RepID=UPI002A7DCAFA|nr:homoserine kinase [Helicobacter sp.]MCI6312238.1 homoserine kinase [Helicobacter sp.]MDD7345755.1 homoserine kinase [Helicobacter sp.]MDY2823636.1 homoserine kinase [Helicobacter sp.]